MNRMLHRLSTVCDLHFHSALYLFRRRFEQMREERVSAVKQHVCQDVWRLQRADISVAARRKVQDRPSLDDAVSR